LPPWAADEDQVVNSGPGEVRNVGHQLVGGGRTTVRLVLVTGELPHMRRELRSPPDANAGRSHEDCCACCKGEALRSSPGANAGRSSD
jgi:hypothetical protein